MVGRKQQYQYPTESLTITVPADYKYALRQAADAQGQAISSFLVAILFQFVGLDASELDLSQFRQHLESEVLSYRSGDNAQNESSSRPTS